MVTLINEREAAEMIGASVRTMQQWRLRGTGPPFRKLSRMVRYSVRDIEIWVDSQRRTSTSDPGSE